jgi:hypothetical protein
MKFGTAIVTVIAAAAAATGGGVEAFSPAGAKGFATNKAGLLVPTTTVESNNNNPTSPLWRPKSVNMDMVAGGAERAAGQEYYEGACVVCCCGRMNPSCMMMTMMLFVWRPYLFLILHILSISISPQITYLHRDLFFGCNEILN